MNIRICFTRHQSGMGFHCKTVELCTQKTLQISVYSPTARGLEINNFGIFLKDKATHVYAGIMRLIAFCTLSIHLAAFRTIAATQNNTDRDYECPQYNQGNHFRHGGDTVTRIVSIWDIGSNGDTFNMHIRNILKSCKPIISY